MRQASPPLCPVPFHLDLIVILLLPLAPLFSSQELGKLEAGKPLSPLTKLRKSGKAGVVPAGDADEGDVAGRLARLLIDRYGQVRMPKQGHGEGS